MTTAFPLAWPEGFPRAKSRDRSRFSTTLPGALKNVQASLRLFGNDSNKPVASIVLSSNVTLGSEKPIDPGVAVYFVWDGLQVCIPVDRYTTVEANLQAIHHIIEARRVELRHGSLSLVRASFAGFTALPPPPGQSHWSTVLGLSRSASKGEIEAAFRERAKRAHPDAGGSTAAMQALTRARDEGLRAAGAN